jgi:hypothetical protein
VQGRVGIRERRSACGSAPPRVNPRSTHVERDLVPQGHPRERVAIDLVWSQPDVRTRRRDSCYRVEEVLVSDQAAASLKE